MTGNDRDFMLRKIRAEYAEKQVGELDELRMLDGQVKKPANIFAYAFGSVGAVVMGAGMSLVMTDIGDTIGMANGLVPGIIIGIVGLAMTLATYPIYMRILAARKKKYAPRILELSDKIMNGEEK